MSIEETFRGLRKNGEGGLIAYITGGDPAPKYTPKLAEALSIGGADILEIGIPFSDPISDGPVIQAADYRALNAGTTPPIIFNIVKETKKRVNIPIALLTYYNILFKSGVKNFLKEAAKHGVDGLIIPDLPIEEAEEYIELAQKQGINTIFLVTPSTSIGRLKDILGFTSGFLYLVSVFGVTGTRDKLARLTAQTIRRFHPHIANAVPLAVGFGLSKPEHVASVMDCGAEGAIVGSAFVKIVENNLDTPARLIEDISALAKKLKTATLLKK
ncbi:MAG: tryptophan synthase subunit alpha [Candidatus Bathyarchaeota archaeon]